MKRSITAAMLALALTTSAAVAQQAQQPAAPAKPAATTTTPAKSEGTAPKKAHKKSHKKGTMAPAAAKTDSTMKPKN